MESSLFQSHEVKGTAAAVFYGTCSVSMAFINKSLMTTFGFDYPVFIMVTQMLFTITALEALSWLRLIELPRYTLERGKSFALPALFYGVNSILGLTALSHMNVAMYGVLKRCSPLFTLALLVIVLKKPVPSTQTIMSVVLLVSGCIIAGYGDLKFNWTAYTCGMLSNIFQSLYLLLVQKFSEKDISTVETLQLNSVNTLPFLTLYLIGSGELSHVLDFDKSKSFSFYVIFVLTISMGCVMNYSLFLCTTWTSALTTGVVGGMKATLQTIFGMFTFGGVSHNTATYSGIFMNLGGGIWYIYAKYIENKRKSTQGQTMKKVMSLSTAEDFRALSSGEMSKIACNGVSSKRNGDLHTIHEEDHSNPQSPSHHIVTFENEKR
ncbi:hypothetical protein FSP39_021036 [Pinctada imbricata]|uniref:Sugar phosphate transporter domain-containing protein n=1 Tax=Pinctada imbricata TaxID=66713 RepID=A0AA88XWC0_PINIB|nr:hypothetical protein FSP39_021036 [Pinctada imbricata]